MSNPNNVFSEFHLPPQDGKHLSFCSAKPRPLQTWLDDLASTQVKQVSIVLYKLLPEVNHLDVNSSQRLGLMSILRPFVHRCIDGLSDDFLKQSLNLNESLTKIAAIAQALQRHLCDGYMITIRQILQANKLSEGAKQELSLALYYAVHGLGQLLYRSYQLYVPQPPQLWKKLHQLHRIAREHKLHNKQIPDELLQMGKSLSVQQAYMRSLLLASSQVNQLRQIDIQYLYSNLETWSSMVSLAPFEEGSQNLYCVDTRSDSGPVYQSRHQSTTEPLDDDALYAIDLNNLTSMLRSYHPSSEDDKVMSMPAHLKESLLAHLKDCWSQEHSRLFLRQQSDTELQVCIGLKAAHQQLLGSVTFEEFLKSHGQLQGSEFSWSQDAVRLLSSQQAGPAPGYYDQNTSTDFFTVTATDTSQQGYCLRWSEKAPPQVKSGEIILLKTPEATQWQVGAIRWAQRLNRHTYVGVQLLEGHAEASAACTTLKNGSETPFFRTVLLKNEQDINVSSLITPTVPFSLMQDVQLQTEEQYIKVKLDHLLLSSGSIYQFSYQPLKEKKM